MLSLAIFLYAGARVVLPGATASDNLADLAGSPTNTLLQSITLAGSLLYAARHPRAIAPRLIRLAPFLLLVALATASAFWSLSFLASFRRGLSFGVLVLFVAYAHAVFGPRGFMRGIVLGVLALTAGSLLEAILRPAVGFDLGDYANAIRGLFDQKNTFGKTLLCGALAHSFLVFTRGRLVWRDLALLVILLVMLVLSRSTTSLVLTLMVAAATVTLLWVDRGGAWMAAALLGLGIGAMAALLLVGFGGSQAVFDAIGKDSSLTGRVFIWEAVRAAMGRRALLGYGYAAFWLPDSQPALLIQQLVEWEVPSAHNGYLETLLQLGYLGGTVVLAVALLSAVLALAALRDGRRRQAMWCLILLVVMGIYNNSESSLLIPDFFLVFWAMSFLILGQRPPPASPPRPSPPGLSIRKRMQRPAGVVPAEGR